MDHNIPTYLKPCAKCNKGKRRPDHSYCDPCFKAYMKAYHARDKERAEYKKARSRRDELIAELTAPGVDTLKGRALELVQELRLIMSKLWND